MKLLLLAIVLWECINKTIVQTFTMRQLNKQQWVYLGKFGAHVGTSNYQIKSVMLKTPDQYQHLQVPLEFEVYLDENWDEVLALPECKRSALATAKSEKQMLKLANNTEPAVFEGSLAQEMRQHMWFIVLNNCEHRIDSRFTTNARTIKLEITIHITNSEGSEFSSEESGFLYLTATLMIMTTIGFSYFTKMLKEDYTKNGELDWPFLFIVIMIGLDMLTNWLHYFHLLVYSYDGSGLIAFKVISEILSVLTNFVLICLLILIAWGWSIEFIDIGDYDLYIPLAAIIAVIQMMIVGLGKLTTDYKYYHCYDGFAGYITLAIYMALFAYFYICTTQRKKKGEQIDNFYRQFTVYASLFFLSFPILLLISKIIAPYLSYKLIMIGTISARLLSVLLLARLFTSKYSSYRMISYKNKAFLDRSKMY